MKLDYLTLLWPDPHPTHRTCPSFLLSTLSSTPPALSSPLDLVGYRRERASSDRRPPPFHPTPVHGASSQQQMGAASRRPQEGRQWERSGSVHASLHPQPPLAGTATATCRALVGGLDQEQRVVRAAVAGLFPSTMSVRIDTIYPERRWRMLTGSTDLGLSGGGTDRGLSGGDGGDRPPPSPPPTVAVWIDPEWRRRRASSPSDGGDADRPQVTVAAEWSQPFFLFLFENVVFHRLSEANRN
jgi:hypothetical protein